MRVTDISVQAKNSNRVNISIDGKYRLSLDIYQVAELGIRNGADVTSEQVVKWEEESEFGKLYARTLEYTLIRPHSAKEIRDYLWRKTRTAKYKTRTGEIKDRAGVSQKIADRVYDRLCEKGYIDDEKFVRYWIENRQQIKGISRRKLIAELRAKGVDVRYITTQLTHTQRTDDDEIQKIIAKKGAKYTDETKLIQYLIRQGFSYDTIKDALVKGE